MLKRIGKIALMMAIVAGFCWAVEALAQGGGTTVVNSATTRLGEVFNAVRKIVFVLGAFTLVGFAVAAIFGKLEWKKVAILAAGLAILGIATMIIGAVIGSKNMGGFAGKAQDITSGDSLG